MPDCRLGWRLCHIPIKWAVSCLSDYFNYTMIYYIKAALFPQPTTSAATTWLNTNIFSFCFPPDLGLLQCLPTDGEAENVLFPFSVKQENTSPYILGYVFFLCTFCPIEEKKHWTLVGLNPAWIAKQLLFYLLHRGLSGFLTFVEFPGKGG